MFLCTVMAVKNFGTLIVSTYKRCHTDTGFVTIAEHSEKLTLANHQLLDPVACPEDVLEASSAGNEVMTQAGIKSGSRFGHASISTSTFPMKTTTRLLLICDAIVSTIMQTARLMTPGCVACRLPNFTALVIASERPSQHFPTVQKGIPHRETIARDPPRPDRLRVQMN